MTTALSEGTEALGITPAVNTPLKFKIASATFAQALGIVNKIVPSKHELSILTHVLIKGEGGKLTLSATDYNSTISMDVVAEIISEGGIAVPSKLLTDFIASLPDMNCVLEVDTLTQVLKITAGGHKTKLHGMSVANYPPLVNFSLTDEVILHPQELEKSILQVAGAASADESRPILTGVHLNVENNLLTLAATDSHRMAVRSMKAKTAKGAKSNSFVVSAKRLMELGKIVGNIQVPVKMSLTNNSSQLLFVTDSLRMALGIIPGNYPDYKKALPSTFATTATVNTKKMQQELKTACILAQDGVHMVRLEIKKDTLTIRATTSEVGGDEVSIPAKIVGPGLEIAFNGKYALEMLQLMDSAEVVLNLNEPLKPGVFTLAGQKDFTYLLMPIRIQV